MSDNGSEIGAFMAGFVIGGLVGAATALILAPQSGEATRAQLASKSQELREAGLQQVETARLRVQDTTTQAQEQARIVLDEGKSKVNTALERGKVAMAEAQEELAPEEPGASEDAAA
jgi:gas vesicle protein